SFSRAARCIWRPMAIYLVRHGETDANASRVCSCPTWASASAAGARPRAWRRASPRPGSPGSAPATWYGRSRPPRFCGRRRALRWTRSTLRLEDAPLDGERSSRWRAISLRRWYAAIPKRRIRVDGSRGKDGAPFRVGIAWRTEHVDGGFEVVLYGLDDNDVSFPGRTGDRIEEERLPGRFTPDPFPRDLTSCHDPRAMLLDETHRERALARTGRRSQHHVDGAQRFAAAQEGLAKCAMRAQRAHDGRRWHVNLARQEERIDLQKYPWWVHGNDQRLE